MELTPEQIKLINILEEFFQKPVDAVSPLLYTTADIFSKLQSVYPSETYTVDDTYQVLVYLKFEFLNSSDRSIKWMIQEKA